MALKTKIYLELTAGDALIDSPFIIKLRALFSAPPAPGAKLWDSGFSTTADHKARMQEIADDIGRAFNSLFTRNEFLKNPPAPAKPNSAEKVIADLLATTSWPRDLANFPVPEPWNAVAFRRYEVAAAMYIIMAAFQRDGSGGGPASLPPSLPV